MCLFPVNYKQGGLLLLHPISPAKSGCPVSEGTINHYGDCCKVTNLGLVFQLSTKQQVLGGFLEGAFFFHTGVQCLKAKRGLSLPANSKRTGQVLRWDFPKRESPYDMDQAPVTGGGGGSQGSFIRGTAGFRFI